MANRFEHSGCLSCGTTFITTAFGPFLNLLPTAQELRVTFGPLDPRSVQASDSDKFLKIMGVARIDQPLFREIVSARSLGDARLQPTLYRISG
jgi:hypothetical protein